MARSKNDGGTATLDNVTSNAVSELTTVANDAHSRAVQAQTALAEAQAAMESALTEAQAANERIVALGGDALDLSDIGGATTSKRRGRPKGSKNKSSGSKGKSSAARTRPRNPYDMPTSILIAMASQRVGSEMNNEAIREALTSNGYKTSASENSFKTQIAQNLSKLVAGEAGEIPEGVVEHVSRGVYALTAEGKAYVKGCALTDDETPEAEAEAEAA